MLAIIGASGKIGGATLHSLLAENLIPASEIICCTSATSSSDERWSSLGSKGVQIRHATFDDPSSLTAALEGADALYLVSSPRLPLDYNGAPYGQGREKDHFAAIDAAVKVGVKHIYYTSLAFARPSKSTVMRAHIRTEEYFEKLHKEVGLHYTILREGLYNESWPLYAGYYDPEGDDRTVVPVGGDSKISWSAIADLGLASAMIIAAPKEEWEQRTVYLSNTREPKTISEIVQMVGKARGKDVRLEVVTKEQHERYYVDDRKMSRESVEWWSTTYDALRDEECLIKDDTFEKLLASKGRTPKPVEETISEMV